MPFDTLLPRISSLGLVALAALAYALARMTPAWGFVLGSVPLWLLVCVVFATFRLQTKTNTVGAATGVTLGRGLILSALLGCAFVAPAGTFVLWLPGALYTAAAVSDLLDGYLARRWNQESPLGARLDVALDALGLMVGPIVAVVLGRLPWWYLLMGATYYAFHGGLWLRARFGRPTFIERMKPSRVTRMYAGYQMGLVAAVLFPVLSRQAATLAAAMFMVPSLAFFARDWLVVTGRLNPDGRRHLATVAAVRSTLWHVLPAVRVGVAGGIFGLIAAGTLPSWLGIAGVLLAAGVAPRVTAFVTAILIALAFGPTPPSALTTLYIGTVVLLLGGAGRAALWPVEDRWLLLRAGEDCPMPAQADVIASPEWTTSVTTRAI